jgi:hypothetical protein
MKWWFFVSYDFRLSFLQSFSWMAEWFLGRRCFAIFQPIRNTMSCGVNIGYRIGTIEWNIFRTIHRMLLKYMFKRSIDFREKDGIGRTTDVNLVQHRFLVFHVAQSVVFCVAFCGRLSFRLHKHYTFSLESRLLPFTVSTNFHHIVFNHVSLIERTKYAWNNVMNVKSRKLTPNKTQVYHLLGAQIKNLRFGNIYFKVCHLRIVSDNTLLRLYWWTQVGMAVTI